MKTKDIGRLVLYTDVIASTQFPLSKKLSHGFAVIARKQTRGRGRGQNEWLSPPGCVTFSIQLHVPLNSTFGGSLPLLQHFIMAAIVSAVRSKEGYENIDLGIKWPNDLYMFSAVKIGGIVVSTIVEEKIAIVNVGCGINLNNENPTTCLNNVIKRYNKEHSKNLPPFIYEEFIAGIFNEIERIFDIVQKGDLDYFYKLYDKFWLHGNSEITVCTKDSNLRKVRVLGIDEYGYLKVKSDEGIVSSVQPDGNSFDMLKGLIAPKIN